MKNPITKHYGNDYFGNYTPVSTQHKSFKILNEEDAKDINSNNKLGEARVFGAENGIEKFFNILTLRFLTQGTQSLEDKARRELVKQGAKKSANVAVVRKATVCPSYRGRYVSMQADFYKI